ncbi:MAG: hypothetical protein ACJZ1S_05405 [Candidatus Neomarinimicrobiota bacterium]
MDNVKRLICIFLFFSAKMNAQENPGFTAPNNPKVYATVDHQKVYLSWDNSAEYSIDGLTGYSDFEGYRIYKSTDGGITWGSANDRLYDYSGNFIGWKPFKQFDLSEDEDINHCIFRNDVCEANEARGTSIFGPDPLNPRFSLGENSGISYALIDTLVEDGIEYTYSVTAYDIGIRTFSIEYVDDNGDGIFDADTIWSIDNPGHFTSTDGTSGYPSLESLKGESQEDSNFTTVVPGYYASNITFPDEENTSEFFMGNSENVGTGEKYYIIVDRSDLAGKLYKFEVQADLGESAVEGMACENPLIYVFEINDKVNQQPVDIDTSYIFSDLTGEEKTLLSGLPGTYENDGQLFIPVYRIIAPMDQISDILDGIRFQFDNLPKLVPVSLENVEFEWSDGFDSTIIKIIDIEFNYNSQASYDRRLNFDYIIEFFSSPVGDTVRNNYCTNFPTVLPFQIKNLTTNRQVGLDHSDLGVSGTLPPDFDNGAVDCMWTRNEEVKFTNDMLLIGAELQDIYSFNIRLDFNYLDQQVSNNLYEESAVYEQGDVVFHKGMMWAATGITSGEEPSPEYIDDNGDGINDLAWQIQYPWTNESYVIIKPKKFFIDGDNWIVDMSELGKPHKVMQDELSQIKVVPNPYLVRSRFNETTNERRMRFTHLPQHCRISIFTISGEIVHSINHDNVYDGNSWWDLKSTGGELVSPGLYIYIVESEGLEHIGKFAVVR